VKDENIMTHDNEPDCASSDEGDAPVTETSALLAAASQGDLAARDRFVEAVYRDLHRRASRLLNLERADHTLQTTALVNEALMRLLGENALGASDRNHFLNIAARQMRRILVDHARARHANKREGLRISLEDAGQISLDRREELVALDDALTALASIDPAAADAVDLKYFGGYTDAESAAILGVNVAKLRRDWEYARAWLHDYMS
jgi:RNA polymerase sigma factor (TIGR02999 family)